MKNTVFMGKEITRQMMLDAMTKFDNERRPGFNKWRTYAVEYGGQMYPPKEILSMASGVSVAQFPGGRYSNSRFEELGFNVTTIEAPPPEDIIETALTIEKDLEEFVAKHLDQIEPGLRLYQGSEGVGRQFNADAVGRLDILALDRNNDFVVLELKAGEAEDQACGQILGYMGWVREKLAGNRAVRGIIVANDFSERLRSASRATANLGLTKYEVTFHFIKVSRSGA